MPRCSSATCTATRCCVLADGSYLKLFRRKRLISSAAWYPYAQRFADNALALAAREHPLPRVIGPLPHPGIEARSRALPAARRADACAS
jgi:hypothetical protein